MPRLALALLLSVTASMAQDSPSSLDIPYARHVLDNGLTVVLHEDHSDPVVAVYVVYHVGSAREEPGRSGFAHLFEHLMFQGSAHVGDDEHFELVSEAGGTLNGSTNRDRTNYFETLPSHQLELALWLEADRMGFLLPAVTQRNLDNQREVVKNERRQNYENRPYAQAHGRIAEALYPSDHGYSWTTIGSHEDLSAATLEDVHAFFRRWYGPNNATLAIAGDIDPEATLALVERYFGPIPRGPRVPAPRPRPVRLEHDERLAMEDDVQLPQLEMVWPTVPRDHADVPALEMLTEVLSANKAALLDAALTVDEQLASRVVAYHAEGDVAGELHVTVRAQPGVELDELEARVRGVLGRLAREGVDPDRLARMKARYELAATSALQTVAARARALGDADALRGDPSLAVADVEARLAVTAADVDRVVAAYLRDGPVLLMSVVPEGGLHRAASGRTPEQIAAEAALDRARRPAAAEPRPFEMPDVWRAELPMGVEVTGSRYEELPIVALSLSFPAGHLRETRGTLGLSALTADLLDEGTENLTATGLVEELDRIGASLSTSSSEDEITVSLRCLRRHVADGVFMIGEILQFPRFAEEDFERLRTERLTAYRTRGDSIRTVARNVWRRLMHDDDSVAAWPPGGTEETLASLTLDDVEGFFARCAVPEGSRLTVVGDLSPDEVSSLFVPLIMQWGEAASARVGPAGPLPLADAAPEPVRGVQVYLVDEPGSPQSELRLGHAGVPRTHPDFYALGVMNHALGGTFSSRINMNLREKKGYTYGARSGFSGDRYGGLFTASSGVRTDVTKESVQELVGELTGILEGFTEAEVAFTRDALVQAMARGHESIRSRAAMLTEIAKYGEPVDYLEQRRAFLDALTKPRLDALAREAIDPANMAILVVGDAGAVRDGLEQLGYGPVVELDIDGDPVDAADA